MSDEHADAPTPVAPVNSKKSGLSRQDRRRLLRTALLAGGVLGAALSGGCAPRAPWRRTISSPPASSAASASRSVRWRH
jgi:hypothetical protein